MYLVNEVFYTLQGEGFWSGRPAVFCRFSRCNLWTGREEDRATAICRFCDTDFKAGVRLEIDGLLDAIVAEWPGGGEPMVVFTGGEPALQLDKALINSLAWRNFYIAIETNGTMPLPDFIDWVCVSPKAGARTVVKTGNELKVVWPQPFDLDELQLTTDFDHYWLSPMDGPDLAENTAIALDYVLANPRWRLNTQTHKTIGIR